MDEAYWQTSAFRAIVAIAEALREEFGVGIDGHPGSPDAEAGQVNRAFRVAAGCILRPIVLSGDEIPSVLGRVLRRVAERRLEASGVRGAAVGILLDLEPALGDSWYAYLALAPVTVIGALVEEERS